MNRIGRFSFNLFAPIVVAPALITIIGTIAASYKHPDPKYFAEFFDAAFLLTIFAGIFGILPSLVHALLMEAVYSKLAGPRTWIAVAISAFSGGFAGTLITGEFYLMASGAFAALERMWAIYTALGLVVGVIVGLLIKSFGPATVTEKKERREPVDTEPSIFL